MIQIKEKLDEKEREMLAKLFGTFVLVEEIRIEGVGRFTKPSEEENANPDS